MKASFELDRDGRFLTRSGLIFLAALAWYAAAEISLAFTFSDLRLAPVWFASGLALAAVYLLGPKALIGILPAAFIANAMYSLHSPGAQGYSPFAAAAGIAAAEGLAAWWGATQLRRLFAHGEVLGSVREMWHFTLVAVVASLLCAVLGSCAVVVSGLAPVGRFSPILISWWLADTAGAIVLIPTLISLSRLGLQKITPKQWLETVLGMAAMGLILSWLFSPYSSAMQTHALTFLLMPLAVWSVFRLPESIVCLFLVLITVLACFATTSGFGPFVANSSSESLRVVQLFVLALSLVVLSLKAGVNERRTISDELKRSNLKLESRVSQRTQELIASNAELAQSIAALKSAESARRLRELKVRALQDVAFNLSINKAIFEGTPSQAAKHLARAARTALQVDRVSIWQADGELMRALTIDDDLAHSEHALFSVVDFESYVAGLEAARALSAADARTDPRTLAFASGYLEPLGIVSLLDAPIRKAAVLSGVVCIEARERRTWSTDEQGFAAVLGDLMGQVFFDAQRREALALAQTENEILTVMSDPSRIMEATQRIVGLFTRAHKAPVALILEGAQPARSLVFGTGFPPPLRQAICELDGAEWQRLRQGPALEHIALTDADQSAWQRCARTEGYDAIQIRRIGDAQSTNGVLLVFANAPAPANNYLSTVLARGTRLLELAASASLQHAQILASEERYRTLYDDNPSMYLTLDGRAQVLAINAFGARRLGFAPDELVGRCFDQLAHQLNLVEFRAALAKLASHPAQIEVREASLRLASGERMWVRLNLRARPSNGGSPEFLLCCEDLTENRALAQRLRHQAEHDVLTGLKNRYSLELAIKAGIENAHKGEPAGALIYLDLDQFKVINDTLGHSAGDELLRQITRVFKQSMPLTAVLGRIGGDEFAAVLTGLSMDRASALAEELRGQLERFRFRMDGNAMQVTASLSVVPIDAQARDAAQVLSAADTACYAAKETGRNRVVLARHDDSEIKRRRGEMQWISKLNRAFDENLFELYCQPIEHFSDTVIGDEYELLLRMKSDTSEPWLPDQFLRAAERFGMGPRIDRWVIGHCFEQLARHPEHLAALGCCAINLSGHSLGFPEFFDDLLSLLKRHQIPPEKICFEVTETAAIAHLGVAERSIRKLSAIGFRFALDDFGSGFSSFAYLKSLPVDTLKIDGNFVRDMLTDPLDFAVVKSIQEVARAMGRRTIAEYVETAAIHDALRALGVDAAQGYFIGRPTPWLAHLASKSCIKT